MRASGNSRCFGEEIHTEATQTVRKGEERGFYPECSPERCDHLIPYIKKHYDKGAGKPKPTWTKIWGVDVNRLMPFAKDAGMPIEFRRCFKWKYVDKLTKEILQPTCTDIAHYRVPQNTIDCYKRVANILQTLRPLKRGRPAKMEREKINTEILGLAGCSSRILKNGAKRVEYEALTPSIAATVTGHELRPVRGAMNNLVWQGKLIGAKKAKGEHVRKLLHVLQEKNYIMPKTYAVIFDDFLTAEEARRVKASKKLFGEVPTIEKREFRHGAEIIKKGEQNFMVGTTGRRRAEAEEEEWRRRTGIVPARFRKFEKPVGTELL